MKALAIVLLTISGPFLRGQVDKQPSPVKVTFLESKSDTALADKATLAVDTAPKLSVRTIMNGMGFTLMTLPNGKVLANGAIQTNFKIDGQVRNIANDVMMMQNQFGGFGGRGMPMNEIRANKGKLPAYTSKWDENQITITQSLEFVPGKLKSDSKATKRSLDALFIKYTVENKDTKPHQVGIRVFLDAMCGDNDGALFAAPTFPGKILDGIELKDKTLPEYVEILERPNLQNPGLVGVFTLKMSGKWIGPDRFVCSSLGAGEDGWNLPVMAANGDSACALFWEPRTVPAGGKLEFAYAYGTSIATMPGSGGLIRLVFGGSFEPGKTFSIHAFVDDPAPAQTLTLDLPDGMHLVEGREMQPVPTPTGTEMMSIVLWKARVERLGEFPLHIRSSNGITQSQTIAISPN